MKSKQLASFFIMAFIVPSKVFSCPSECRCSNMGDGYSADCQGRQLQSVPQGLPVNTTTLFLSGNELADNNSHILTSDKLQQLQNLSKLQNLHLDNNGIQYISPDAFQNLSSLKRLTLRNNFIVNIPTDALRQLPNITILEMGDNLLGRLQNETFIANPLLQHLLLQNNEIMAVEERALRGLAGLVTLDLSQNEIENLSGKVFSENVALEQVRIDNNCLSFLNPGVLSQQKNLKVLSIIYNKVNDSIWRALSGTTNLTQLFLYGNRIETIPSGALANNTNLLELYLHENHIRNIGIDAFRGLTKLFLLQLSQNLLSYVPDGAFDVFNENTFLCLAQNDWICDCNVTYLQASLQRFESPLCGETTCRTQMGTSQIANWIIPPECTEGSTLMTTLYTASDRIKMSDAAPERMTMPDAASQRMTTVDAASKSITLPDTVSERITMSGAAPERMTMPDAASQGMTMSDAASQTMTTVDAASKSITLPDTASERITIKMITNMITTGKTIAGIPPKKIVISIMTAVVGSAIVGLIVLILVILLIVCCIKQCESNSTRERDMEDTFWKTTLQSRLSSLFANSNQYEDDDDMEDEPNHRMSIYQSIKDVFTRPLSAYSRSSRSGSAPLSMKTYFSGRNSKSSHQDHTEGVANKSARLEEGIVPNGEEHYNVSLTTEGEMKPKPQTGVNVRDERKGVKPGKDSADSGGMMVSECRAKMEFHSDERKSTGENVYSEIGNERQALPLPVEPTETSSKERPESIYNLEYPSNSRHEAESPNLDGEPNVACGEETSSRERQQSIYVETVAWESET